MATSSHWQLFGYDLRGIAGFWRSAWRELFWSQNSRLRVVLDEPVRLHYPDGRTSGPADARIEARVLPDELVLSRELTLPQAVEADLDSVLALEVRANSPFPAEDTAYGWRLTGRNEQSVTVALAIVSRSAVLGHLREQVGEQQMDSVEVWTSVGGALLVIEGFGEQRRYRRYRRRLRRLGAGAVYCLILMVLILSIPLGIRYAQWSQYQQLYEQAQAEASSAVRLRSELAAHEQRLASLDDKIESAPRPYRELQRLTTLLGDDAWLTQFDHREARVRIDGQADNAAALMQDLSTRGWYSDVRATSAIRRQRSGKESFSLELVPSADPVTPEEPAGEDMPVVPVLEVPDDEQAGAEPDEEGSS